MRKVETPKSPQDFELAVRVAALTTLYRCQYEVSERARSHLNLMRAKLEKAILDDQGLEEMRATIRAVLRATNAKRKRDLAPSAT